MSGCGSLDSVSCSGGVCRRAQPAEENGQPAAQGAQRLELFLYDVGSSYVVLEYPTTVKGEDLAKFHIDLAITGNGKGNAEATEWEVVSKNLKGGFVKKKGLNPGTSYSFRIRGLMMPQKEWSAFSPVLSVSTLSEKQDNSRPVAVKSSLEEGATADTGAKIRIQWEAPGMEAIQRYQVEFRRMSAVGLPWSTISDKLKGTQVIKKNIIPGTDYVFRVRAESSTNDWTAWSVPSAPTTTLLALNEAFYRLFGNAQGTLVRDSNGLRSAPLEELSNKMVGLYFSASWCPPCQQFTPRLVQFYNQVVLSGRQFEVVFISADRDETSFRQYFSKMPWLALDFHNSRRTEIPSLYQVQGIPRLIVSESKPYLSRVLTPPHGDRSRFSIRRPSLYAIMRSLRRSH